MRSIRSLAASLLLTLVLGAHGARAASVSAWAWSYETSETDVGASQAVAEIARQGPGAPGESHAGASARYGALSSYSQLRGCGFEFNNFQQVCNDARSGADPTDTLHVTANLPFGSIVQVRVTMTLAGEVHGKGGYSCTAQAWLEGEGASIVGGTGGTVQSFDHLPISGTRVFDAMLRVGYTHVLTHSLTTGVLQRDCAGGSQDCYDSEHVWTIYAGASSGLRIEVLTLGVNAQLASASGHDYTQPTADVRPAASAGARLAPAWPNPARDAVHLALALDEASVVDAAVFDIAGRRVATLAQGVHAAGTHVLAWDGRDASGRQLRGVFFVRARGPRFDLSRRVLITRG